MLHNFQAQSVRKKFSLIVVLIGLFSPSLFAANDDIALVWQAQGKKSYDIFYSNFVNGEWTPPFAVTQNKLNDATPAIIGDAQGNHWVMWSEANGEVATSLKYRVKEAGIDSWGDPKLFETGLENNSMPSLLRDETGQIWCFWAGVDGEDDEIYYSRFIAGKWQKPSRLNPNDNQVPDILPQPTIKNGKPSVAWLGFDINSRQYRHFRTDWDGKKWTKPRFELISPFSAKTLDKNIKIPVEINGGLHSLYDSRRYPNEAYYFGR